MKTIISFADLTHTRHACNAIPYGIALVASYASKNLGNKIEVDLFKYPTDFIEYLEKTIPKIACFSNYIWNMNLSYEFARQIKKKSADSIIIFGGPNYPIETEEQKAFLLLHPDIDFYIYREGERSFVALFNKLLEYNFDFVRIKKSRLNIPNCHYINDGVIIQGNLMHPLSNLDEIPSPYLTGCCDKFLAKGMIPLTQITRGCPFKCTYCQEGNEYFNTIRRFSSKRIKDELEYIAQRTIVPTLIVADANFGMYKEDVEISREIALVQKKYGWPKYFMHVSGKNYKDRILEVAAIIQGSSLSAAVQSTDEKVLKNIKRENVSLSQMIQVAKERETLGSISFSEVILCLPGDTKDAHFKSILELIDAGIKIVRSHQLIMLPGSEISTKKSREQYDMVTRFRVMPYTVSPYQLFGEIFYAPEIDEICVANASMSFEDYLECRLFNLTVEIFYNDGIFQELLKFLRLHNISIPFFIMNIHKHICSGTGSLSDFYDGFLRKTKELWNNRCELITFLQQPNVIDRYISGELGNNEQLMYRSLTIFKHMDKLHKTAFDIATEMLSQKGCFNERYREYLGELSEFSLLRKKDILSIDIIDEKYFHYDFVDLAVHNFNETPLSYYKPEGINIVFFHTEDQKELISKQIKCYGLSNYGLVRILSYGPPVSNFYRKIKKVVVQPE